MNISFMLNSRGYPTRVAGLFRGSKFENKNFKRKGVNTNKETAHRNILRCTNKNPIRNLGQYLTFIFSEPCIVIHIREKDQPDTYFFLIIYFN